MHTIAGKFASLKRADKKIMRVFMYTNIEKLLLISIDLHYFNDRFELDTHMVYGIYDVVT